MGIINSSSANNSSIAGQSLQCDLCDFVPETSLAGLMHHKRHCHAKKLNDDRKAIPPQNKGMRWNDDELLLMARCELALLKRDGVMFFNIELERKLNEDSWNRIDGVHKIHTESRAVRGVKDTVGERRSEWPE